MSNIKIMYVDDEDVILSNVKDYFSDYDITFFTSSEEALKEIQKTEYDIILSDYKMPGLTGLDLLINAKKSSSYSYGVLLTAYAEKNLLEEMVNKELVNRIIEKPFRLKDLKTVLDELITLCTEQKKEKQLANNIKINYELLKNENSDELIGADSGLKDIYKKILTVSKHQVNVLITGETGTGKELIAKTIHFLSPRKDGPFIKINSTAIPESLFESELFGYKKGAFSNAFQDKPGKIEMANGGTLFLDEIGDMDLSLQTKLLRVLQEKEVERLGSNKVVKVDFRLIVAANKNLQEKIDSKLFREDLFYRMNEFPITLPPLRERKQDIIKLAIYFIKKACDELKIKYVELSKEAEAKIVNYSWPGNVRELKNAMKRVVIANGEDVTITEEHLDFLFSNRVSSAELTIDSAISLLKDKIISKQLQLTDIENLVVDSILKEFDNNVALAVEKTGVSKNRFYKIK